MNNIDEVISHFRTKGSFISAASIGSGHINDSFLIDTGRPEKYVLQRINHSIFRNVDGLMNNISLVTEHIGKKILSHDPAAGGFQRLQLIPTTEGKTYHRDWNGNFWRLYNHISGACSYDVVENAQLAYEGGRAFGRFQLLTSDIKCETLVETIPFFHDIEKRLQTFRETVSRDPVGRAIRVSAEIGFVEQRADEMHSIIRMGREGKIRLRVTHNDTKFNNILFDENKRAVCIVDLDTMMPGYVLYDFGDAIRTGANTGAEDADDLTAISISLELFTDYARGYLEIAKGFLNEAEIGHLAFSAKFMTFIIGLRFLTDHIDGDHYYRIHHPGHNLQRAKAQFRLLESMEENFEKMKRIVDEVIK